MENFSARRLTNLFCSLALVLGVCGGCQRKTETAAPASPTPAGPATEVEPVAPPISGPVTPALVTQGPDSVSHYLHFPKDPEAAKLDGAVQFYCDVLETGMVESTHALVGNNNAFKAAVQTALDWGRFAPATVNGQPARVYVGGTVLFLHQNNEELIIVSLATHDRDRVGKLANYIQPQLIGGLRQTLQKAISRLTKGVLVAGQAEVAVNVDAKGAITGTSAISENPKGSGLADLLNKAVRQAQFTPAYENGKATAGGINVVADFGLF